MYPGGSGSVIPPLDFEGGELRSMTHCGGTGAAILIYLSTRKLKLETVVEKVEYEL